MATKKQLVDDIILRVTKGKPSDDLELEPRQVAFWIDLVLNNLVKATLDGKLSKGDDFIDPAYICYERLVPLKIENSVYGGGYYIDLCNEPINLYRDRGVIRVATETSLTEVSDWVDKMKMSEIDNLNKLKFGKPSLKNIKYHRVKNRLYFHGLTDDTYNLITFLVAYVPRTQALELMDGSDQVFVGDDILPALSEEVEKIARRQIYQSDIDNTNDGEQGLNADGQ